MGFKTQLATLLNISVEDITKAIEEDKKLDISGITVFSDSELESNNEKIKESAKNETIKTISTDIGIDISKTSDLKTAIAEKFSDVDSKAEIAKLTEKLTKQAEDFELLQSQNATLKKENISFAKSIKADSIIPDGYTVAREDIKDIFLMKSNVDVDESGNLFFKNADGTPKVDKKNQVVRPTKEDVVTFLDSRGYTKVQADAGDNTGGDTNKKRNVGTKFPGINSVADIEKYAQTNNIDPRSQKYRELVTEIYNENPDITK